MLGQQNECRRHASVECHAPAVWRMPGLRFMRGMSAGAASSSSPFWACMSYAVKPWGSPVSEAVIS